MKLKTALKVLRITLCSIIAIILIGVIIFGLFVYFRVKPVLDKAKATSYTKMSSITDGTFINAHNTLIYDKNDSLIGEININNFEYATIDNISPYIQNGYIAVEDRQFLVHSGIDYKALLRASIALIKNKGEVTQGGSTITQQVLKNNVLNDIENNWERKLVEFFLAPELEDKYSKNQIMEFYCNTNYYQNGCYGVESASQFYFGKSAKEVTLSEAAGLVGISNNPSKYNPVKHLDAYKDKRKRVLEDMLECGYITEVQYNESVKDEVRLVLSDKKRVKESYQVSFALHCATLEEMAVDGFQFKYTFETEDEYNQYKTEYNSVYRDKANEIRNGGYKIYTALDQDVQTRLQEYVDKEMSTYKEVGEDGRYLMQASATVVDNETGYVIAIVGGRGTDDEFNRAYQSFRQPGSCAKPIASYGPAFDTGSYYPSKQVNDRKTSIAPSNWDNVYRGNISIRESLERSINTVAFYVLQDLTPKTATEYLSKMRFSGLSYLDTYNGSLAVGGWTYGTTTFEMSKAYQTLVNDGLYDNRNCLRTVIKTTGGEEIEIYNSKNTKETEVYSKDTAYMLIDCLKGVLTRDYATGKAMAIPDVIAAGKTGTTNSNKDGWFCGVTPKYSVAVWAGYDMPRPVLDMGGGKYPGAIYKDIMTDLMQGYHNLDFNKPDTVESCYINSSGERTSRNTGRQDLFSNTLLREAELRRKEEAERKKQAEVEKQQKEQKYLYDNIKSELEIIQKTEIKDLSEYERVMRELSKIDTTEIKSSIQRDELNSLIDTVRTDIESNYGILKMEYDTKIQQEEEQAKQEEAQRKEQLYKKRIEIAEKAVISLENWKSSAVSTSELKSSALSAINACKSYNEYDMLKERYDTVVMEISIIKQQERERQVQQSQKQTQQQTEQTEPTSGDAIQPIVINPSDNKPDNTQNKSQTAITEPSQSTQSDSQPEINSQSNQVKQEQYGSYGNMIDSSLSQTDTQAQNTVSEIDVPVIEQTAQVN